MPVAFLYAYSTMLPRLMAEESLQEMVSIGVAFGGGDEGKKTISLLQRQARGEKIPKIEEEKVSGRQFAAMMGFPVRVKKKKE